MWKLFEIYGPRRKQTLNPHGTFREIGYLILGGPYDVNAHRSPYMPFPKGPGTHYVRTLGLVGYLKPYIRTTWTLRAS